MAELITQPSLELGCIAWQHNTYEEEPLSLPYLLLTLLPSYFSDFLVFVGWFIALE